MTFNANIEKKEYDTFVNNHPLKSHFLQSYAWGEFAHVSKNLYPHYVGLYDDDKLCAATLLLEKKLPFGYSYYYAPRGFVMDMTNESLLKEFTEMISKYIKKRKGIFLKVDPDIILKEEDDKGNIIEHPYDGSKVISSMQKVGYKHLGFTKNFETSQPRYTFRMDLTEPLEVIEARFHKSVKQRIKKAEEYEIEVSLAAKEEVKDFFELMKITEHRKDFVSHDLSYYQNLFDIWNQDHTCNIFLGKIDLEKIIDKRKQTEKELKEELSKIGETELSKSLKNQKKELMRRLEKVTSDIEKYQKTLEEYGSKIILNGHFIIEYGDKAWVLYAGNHNILSETGSNYKTYVTHLKYCKEKGIKIYDQFGTIGDLREENPLYGLHDFKKKFGGNYVEFIGEFDYVTNHFMYFIFTKLVPFYRKIKMRRAKSKK